MDLLKAPARVSPTIKFARWSFLFWGIVYGWNRKAVLEIREKKDRVLRREALERKRKLQLDQTKKSFKELLIFFGELVGVEFPPNWTPPE